MAYVSGVLRNSLASATFAGIAIAGRMVEVYVAQDMINNAQALDKVMLQVITSNMPEPLQSFVQEGLKFVREKISNFVTR